jgi:D-alanine-D-alanine ligase
VGRRLRVGIFAGGRSAEHEVSVASADSVLRSIDRDVYEPYVVYIDRDGRWHLPAGPAPELGSAGLGELLDVEAPSEHTRRLLDRSAQPVALVPGEAPLAAPSAVRSLAESIDVAFLVLHGPFGEDGTLQGFLELAGIPYTGAGVLASAVAMDKVIFKDLMRGHGLPVVDYSWFRRSAWTDAPDEVRRKVTELLGSQVVVKPARLGSSVGMSLVHDTSELGAAMDEAFRYDSKALVERYLPAARELECGVLGNDRPVVFEPGEVRSHHEWYDYESKYTAGLADVLPRADVDPSLAELLKRTALAAYMAVDCSGFARVDFLVADGAVYLSEMNTIPGFTATSMFPKQAELAGIGFGELVERIIDLGLAQAAEGRTPGAADSPRDERDATDEEANP